MKIQNDIKMYAQILNEAAEEKARYEEACNEFEKHRNDFDDEIDEAAIVVDAAYIQKATKALEPLKAKDKDAYNNALKYLEGQKGHQLAVDAETFAKNRIARANAAAGASKIQTISKADDRWELMQKVAADKKAARDKEEQEKMTKVFTNEIIITDVKMVDNNTCKITYEIKQSDGKDYKDNEFMCPIDDEEFVKAKRSMGAKSVESAAVALLQQSYDSRAARPIKWTFFNKKTGVKQDGTKFIDVVQAKKRIVKQPETIDPAKEKAYDLAYGYNKQYGNSNLRYSIK